MTEMAQLNVELDRQVCNMIRKRFANGLEETRRLEINTEKQDEMQITRRNFFTI
jgi:hypothetical protein